MAADSSCIPRWTRGDRGNNGGYPTNQTPIFKLKLKSVHKNLKALRFDPQIRAQP
jgi:hypothetical protein